jgi:Protein of unknown function (DUF3568)
MSTYGIKVLAVSGAILFATQGCAAVGLSVFGAGAGVAGGTGTSYTLDSVAYRTFTISPDDMRRATLSALKRMDITIQTDEATPEGRHFVAQAGDRTIDIELERLTSRTTRMRVAAKHGWIFRDRATAGEIIAQTEHSVDLLPAVTRKEK